MFHFYGPRPCQRSKKKHKHWWKARYCQTKTYSKSEANGERCDVITEAEHIDLLVNSEWRPFKKKRRKSFERPETGFFFSFSSHLQQFLRHFSYITAPLSGRRSFLWAGLYGLMTRSRRLMENRNNTFSMIKFLHFLKHFHDPLLCPFPQDVGLWSQNLYFTR